MKLLGFSSVLLPALVAAATDMKKCAFVSEEITTPVSYELPLSVLSHSKYDLPIDFRGLEPVVTRKTLPYGATPKITVTRYSHDVPDITFDEEGQRVIITGSHCSAQSSGNNNAGGGSNNNAASEESSACSAYFTAGLSNKYWVAASLVAAGLAQYPVVAAGAVLAGMMPGANAHTEDDDTCMSSVEVVVEAPASYEGAVEACWADINNTAVCPDPFPTFPTCDNPAPDCGVAVVGGGAGGLYTALR